jgi:hypothetical protein
VTGVTAYLKNGGTLEKAQMANHASRTTQAQDRRREELSLDEGGEDQGAATYARAHPAPTVPSTEEEKPTLMS